MENRSHGGKVGGREMIQEAIAIIQARENGDLGGGGKD